ncbi:family 2 glycoside hydrolase [Melampsora larici-populina 98AG31]|uniref:Family 2 glycoside hydrolase n=1 Tax=Melampsora larici-populina (strain 98AG31 / pathotype 3-4-7) TaxID=747676 RepID=F4RHU9_MELLP|nr:family 2 glycoside hydrolase [Melampsora larici-populina 98AG31]EGG08070.1 family 2 glycoside hydrolase [Melampsora larici-populina 98AG31]
MIRILVILFIISISLRETVSQTNNVTSYKLKEGPLDTEWTQKVGLNPWPEYPRPQLKQTEWKNLNGLWQLKFGNSSLELDSPPFSHGGNDNKGFNQEILIPFCVESSLSGIMKNNLTYLWYRKTFVISKDWNHQKVLLNFGAIDYEATIFLNGININFHRGGYFKFSIELSQYLKPIGEENELLVFVYDPTDTGGVRPVGKQAVIPSHVFYTATTGIWQTVFLEPVPDVYVTKLDANADMHGVVNLPVKVTLHSQQPSSSSTDQTSALPPTLLTVTGTSNKPFTFKLDSPKLWSPATPNLYYFTVQLGNDIVESYLGFRTIEKKLDQKGIIRPFLNGEFVFQIGPLDQGFWPDGIYTPPTYEAMESDLKLLKQLGFNMLRKHVKIEADLYYYACDQLGLLVWQDIPSLNLFPDPAIEQSVEFERQVYRMVAALNSFPCIVTWVIFNEGWGQTSGSPEIEITEKVRVLDPTRLVMSVSGSRDHGAGDFSDNHHYASPQCGTPFYSLDSSTYDSKRIGSQGEFGGIGQIPELKNAWNVKEAIESQNRTYEITTSSSIWNYCALRVIEELKEQSQLYSCSAGVYTQTSDIEGEVNGLVTYDRHVVRPDIKKWNTLITSLYNSPQ